ncbi:TPA: hypothetical protein N0F65_003331 [Lagenidium giganteum]|uniref:EF-hand domain-containing protein n=1 Tax=Lagenidium giganteum TaxID=4803 RepID=A0AAV2ZAN5_9STRA|nr:TPA: hypothetical protein N0F65_003331 [Lagenidium giganteum]
MTSRTPRRGEADPGLSSTSGSGSGSAQHDGRTAPPSSVDSWAQGSAKDVNDDHYMPLQSPQSQSMRLRLLRQKSSLPMNRADRLVFGMKKMMHLDKARGINDWLDVYESVLFSHDVWMIWIAAFITDVRLSLRIAVGVLLAGVAQTRTNDTTSGKQWVFLPSNYYLGGLTYAAVMVIFAAARNIGGVVEQVWQIGVGVATALVYNFVVFSIVPLTQGHIIHVPVNLGGTAYSISLHDWGICVPLLLLFTFLVFISPVQTNVKKFAVGTNLYFMLTNMSPMNPVNPTTLKNIGDHGTYGTNNLMANLAIYSVVGAVGTLIALLTMFLPYPIFAIRALTKQMHEAPHDIREILNLIVDSYCFRAKDIKEMDFFQMKLIRLMETAQKRLQDMNQLLDNCWWEQVVGFGMCFRFNKTISKQFVKLYASLLKDLHAMKFAIEQESCHWTHVILMKRLQKNLYVLQAETNDLLDEISLNVIQSSTEMPSSKFNNLEANLERVMHKYAALYGELLSSNINSPGDIDKTMPLNLFLYSFHALAHTLLEFEHNFKHKNFTTRYRAKNFVKRSIEAFWTRASYTKSVLFFAFRTTLAVALGICCSTFVFAFDSTIPNAIAMVAEHRIGGTYSNTANRLTGLVAGTVLPSIFNFFICKLSDNVWYNTLNNAVLFIWTVLSMYVYFSGSYLSTAGMVSAFMTASVLLDHSCRRTVSSTLSYSSLTGNSLGILILMVVELLLHPQSAKGLLRVNVQRMLTHFEDAFTKIFSHHVCLDRSTHRDSVKLCRLTEKERHELRHLLSVTIPEMLVSQEKLLREASLEPVLWRPMFSVAKYTQVLEICRTLLDHIRILFDLIEWHEKRKGSGVEAPISRPRTTTIDAQASQSGGAGAAQMPAHIMEDWMTAQEEFLQSVEETLDTLRTLFGEAFSYAEAADNAIFMQMKEAFRIADVHRRGEVDAQELGVLLEKIVPFAAQNGNVQLEQYVDEFMKMVDQNKDGKVSFAEFMNALNHGFRLELEIYENIRSNATTLNVTKNEGRGSSPRQRAFTNKSGRTLPHCSSSIQSQDDVHSSFSSYQGDLSKGAGYLAQSDSLTSSTKTKTVNGKDVVLLDQSFFQEDFTDSNNHFGDSNKTLESRVSIESVGMNDALLNVESFTIKEAAAQFKRSYCEYLLKRSCTELVPMEDFILMSCLICGTDEIAMNLSKLNAVAAT